MFNAVSCSSELKCVWIFIYNRKIAVVISEYCDFYSPKLLETPSIFRCDFPPFFNIHFSSAKSCADFKVFFISIVIVIGPTPPGTGVI